MGSTVSALAALAPRVVDNALYRLGARCARASCGGKWVLPSRRSLRSRLVWWKMGTTVSALAALAPRVVDNVLYRLGARCARTPSQGLLPKMFPTLNIFVPHPLSEGLLPKMFTPRPKHFIYCPLSEGRFFRTKMPCFEISLPDMCAEHSKWLCAYSILPSRLM